MKSTSRKQDVLRGRWVQVRLFDGLVFGTVFVGVFGLVLLHALPLPRLYRSTVTVAVAEDAMERGWDSLRASDLPSWLPIIAPHVARRFDNRSDGTAFLKPHGLDGKDRLARITELIRRDLKAVYDTKTATTTVSFRHPDFKVAGEVVSWAGHEYCSHLQREETRDRGKLNERWEKQMSKVEALKKQAEIQGARLDAAASALQVFRERQNRLGKKETGRLERSEGRFVDADPVSVEEEYRRLAAAVREGEAKYKVLVGQLRDLTMLSEPKRPPVRVVNYSGWAASCDFVWAPISVRALWAGLAGLGCGVTVVIVTRLVGGR